MTPQKVENSSDKPNLDDLISLSEAATISGLSPNHLRLLVSRGTIWGKKIGRNWVTSLRAVSEYVSLDHRPGPKSKKDG